MLSPQLLERYTHLDTLRVSRGFVIARCYDSQEEREVVIKHIRPAHFRSRKYRIQLKKETRIAYKGQHAGLIELLDWDRSKAPLFCVFTYYPSGCLSNLLFNKVPVSPHWAAKICADVADALAVLHSRGYVHLDIKHANVLLDDLGRAVICDFGLSRSSRYLRQQRRYLGGTPGFMSPEQAALMRKNTDLRADVFALGAMLYQLVTGEMPVQGTRKGLYFDNLCSLKERPVAIPNDFPPALASVVSG